jgi:hypothetical protein
VKLGVRSSCPGNGQRATHLSPALRILLGPQSRSASSIVGTASLAASITGLRETPRRSGREGVEVVGAFHSLVGYTWLARSIGLLSGIVGATGAGSLFLGMAIEHELVNSRECGGLSFRRGARALRVGGGWQSVRTNVPRGSHQFAEACSMNSRRLGRWIRTLLTILAALRSPLLT